MEKKDASRWGRGSAARLKNPQTPEVRLGGLRHTTPIMRSQHGKVLKRRQRHGTKPLGEVCETHLRGDRETGRRKNRGGLARSKTGKRGATDFLKITQHTQNTLSTVGQGNADS